MDDIPIAGSIPPAAVEGGAPRAPSEGQGRGRRRPGQPAAAPAKAKPKPRPLGEAGPGTDDDGHHIDILI